MRPVAHGRATAILAATGASLPEWFWGPAVLRTARTALRSGAEPEVSHRVPGGHVARDPDRLDRVRGRVEPLAALAREREEPAPDRLAGGHIRYTLGPAPAAARVDLDLAVPP